MSESPSPLGFEGAFLVVWHIAGSTKQIWFGGRSGKSPEFLSGKTSFYDAQRGTKILRGPYHSLQFHLPRSVTKHFASENTGWVIDDRCNLIDIAVCDPVIDELGRKVLDASFARKTLNSPFLARILGALFARMAYACTETGTVTPQAVGLAAWQERRAKDLLNSGAGANVPLRRLAAACGLSVSQFVRAFRKSTGLPPRQWQLRMRIERAKRLMRQSEMPLSQVALDCGFGDQSHFTRAFARAVGATPSAWRKASWSRSDDGFACVDLCNRERNELLTQVKTDATRDTERRRSEGFEPARMDRPDLQASAVDAENVRSQHSPVAGRRIIRRRIPESALQRLPVRAATLEGLLDGMNVDRVDRTIARCSSSLECRLSATKPPSQSFVDQLLRTVAAHLARRAGGDDRRAPRRGLAPWQERRVKDLMIADLATNLSLKRLANECDLSVTQFARAFRQSTGKPPHHWLLDCRVETALAMLAGSPASLGEIASSCGFANQSHFTRTFAKKVGMAPSAWRRLHGNGRL